MKASATRIADVFLIEPEVFGDERGFFLESFNERRFAQQTGVSVRFVQDNHSLSVPAGVVRGLHFQSPPRAQGKLIRVLRGSIFDVAVDIRVGSSTFGKHVTAVLTADNRSQLWVPKGFAHGFCTLEPHTEVFYKVTDYYAPETDRGLRWDDPQLGIAWPVAATEAILSAKDRLHPVLSELSAYFRY